MSHISIQGAFSPFIKSTGITLDKLDLPVFRRFGVQVQVLRLDRVHPMISGNKWFKLLPQLEHGDPTVPILSFGGAFSNHLHALAWAGKKIERRTIGIVRGESQQTPTLADAKRWGMELHFISRSAYREKTDSEFLVELQEKFGSFQLVPEGGSNRLAVDGCRQIWSLPALEGGSRPDVVILPVGSGGTLAGMALGAPEGVRLEGVSVFADLADLELRVKTLLGQDDLGNWSINQGPALRYGKINAELSALLTRFEAVTSIELDAIYTVRAISYLLHALNDGRYPVGTRLIVMHTGGLQGNRGQSKRLSRLASAFCGPLPL